MCEHKVDYTKHKALTCQFRFCHESWSRFRHQYTAPLCSHHLSDRLQKYTSSNSLTLFSGSSSLLLFLQEVFKHKADVRRDVRSFLEGSLLAVWLWYRHEPFQLI